MIFNGKQEDYISPIPKGKKNFKFKFTMIPIEKNYVEIEEATTLRDAVVEDYATLRELLPDLTSFKEPLSSEDWRVVKNSSKLKRNPLHPFVIHVLEPMTDHDIRKEVNDPTVAECMRQFVAFRNSKTRLNVHGPVPRGQRSTYAYWMNYSPLRDMKWSLITKAMVEKERNKLGDEGRTASTVRSYTSALSASHSHFFGVDFMVDTLLVDGRTDEGEHTMYYEEYEVKAIIEACDRWDEKARIQNSKGEITKCFEHLGIMIRIFAETGMRKDTVATLRPDEVHNLDNPNRDELRTVKKVAKGKNIKIPLSDYAVELLESQKQHVKNGWYFPSVEGKGYKPNVGWYARFKKMLKAEGLYKPHPYKLIHSFRAYVANRIIVNGGNTTNICEVLDVTYNVAEGYKGRSPEGKQVSVDFLNKSRRKYPNKTKSKKPKVVAIK